MRNIQLWPLPLHIKKQSLEKNWAPCSRSRCYLVVETGREPRTRGSQLCTFWAGQLKQTTVEKLKSKNAEVAKRSINILFLHSIFSMTVASYPKCSVLRGKLWFPIHFCMLCCPLTQPRLQLHSLISALWKQLHFPVLFILVFSLPTISPCHPDVANPNSIAIPL